MFKQRQHPTWNAARSSLGNVRSTHAFVEGASTRVSLDFKHGALEQVCRSKRLVIQLSPYPSPDQLRFNVHGHQFSSTVRYWLNRVKANDTVPVVSEHDGSELRFIEG